MLSSGDFDGHLADGGQKSEGETLNGCCEPLASQHIAHCDEEAMILDKSPKREVRTSVLMTEIPVLMENTGKRTKMIASRGTPGVVDMREGTGVEWKMNPHVAERINDLLSTEGLSPVKCRDKFLVGLCNVVARTCFDYRRSHFRRWHFLVSCHQVLV